MPELTYQGHRIGFDEHGEGERRPAFELSSRLVSLLPRPNFLLDIGLDQAGAAQLLDQHPGVAPERLTDELALFLDEVWAPPRGLKAVGSATNGDGRAASAPLGG